MNKRFNKCPICLTFDKRKANNMCYRCNIKRITRLQYEVNGVNIREDILDCIGFRHDESVMTLSQLFGDVSYYAIRYHVRILVKEGLVIKVRKKIDKKSRVCLRIKEVNE